MNYVVLEGGEGLVALLLPEEVVAEPQAIELDLHWIRSTSLEF